VRGSLTRLGVRFGVERGNHPKAKFKERGGFENKSNSGSRVQRRKFADVCTKWYIREKKRRAAARIRGEGKARIRRHGQEHYGDGRKGFRLNQHRGGE